MLLRISFAELGKFYLFLSKKHQKNEKNVVVYVQFPPGGGSSEKYTPLYYVQKTNQNQYNVYPYLKPLDESMFGQVEVQD